MTVLYGGRFVGVWCCLLAIVYVISHVVQVGDAQAYHFSKGWMPGRKRSSSSSSDAAQQLVGKEDLDRRSRAAAACAVRSQSYQLALDILKVRQATQRPTLGGGPEKGCGS